MNKKILLSAAAVLVLVSVNGISYANDDVSTPVQNLAAEKQYRPVMPPPNGFEAPAPMHKFKGHHPTKEEMEAKRAEFEKRLKLSDEQKKQIELNKQKDIETIKPIIDELHAKIAEKHKIRQNKELKVGEAEKMMADVDKQIRDLKIQADNLRKENMKNFENLLTEKQKKEFAKIKDEQKKEMEKRRKNFEGKKGPKHPPIGLPVEPKPMPLEK